MVDVERKIFAVPVRKQFHKRAALQQFVDAQRHGLRDPEPRHARGQSRRNIVQDQPPVYLDGYDLTPAMELPVERPSSRRIAEQQAFMRR